MRTETSDRITNETGVVPKTAPAPKALNFKFYSLQQVRDRDTWDRMISEGATIVPSREVAAGRGAIGVLRYPIEGYLRNHLVWHLAHDSSNPNTKLWSISHESGWLLLGMGYNKAGILQPTSRTKTYLWAIYRNLVLCGEDWASHDPRDQMFTSRFQPALSKAMDKAFKEIEEKKLIAQQARVDRAEAVEGDRSPF